MPVSSCECCVLPGRERLVRQNDHPYRGVLLIVVCLGCDGEASIMSWHWPTVWLLLNGMWEGVGNSYSSSPYRKDQRAKPENYPTKQ